MREMKDSGVEWIGEIPNDWIVGRIKYNYYLKGRIGWQGLKADEFIDEGPYLVTGTDFVNGKVNWNTCYHISKERYYEAPEIHVNIGDLLITKDGTVGKVAFIDDKPEQVSLNSHLLIMRPLNKKYNNRYLFWVIQSPVFDKYFVLSQNGTIMASLSQEKINDFSFALPSEDVQKRIADYLDDKCAKIDSIIEKQQTVIEKLKEYKLSVITEAVTKGLNPDVEMKDSGVEWIGPIPVSWNVTKASNLYEIKLGKMLQPNQENDDDTLESYLCAANLGGNKLKLDSVKQMWFSQKERNNYLVKKGDLLVVEGGDVASCDIVSEDISNLFIQNALHRVRPKNRNDVRFLRYFLMAAKRNGYIDLICNKATIAHFSKEKFMAMPTTFPDVNEQTIIADFLDKKCSELEKNIIDRSSIIDKLIDYKKSLIYEVVTGKKEV